MQAKRIKLEFRGSGALSADAMIVERSITGKILRIDMDHAPHVPRVDEEYASVMRRILNYGADEAYGILALFFLNDMPPHDHQDQPMARRLEAHLAAWRILHKSSDHAEPGR